MFNVTVIKLKDIVKFLIIVIAISALIKLVFNNLSIKNFFGKSISINTSDFIELGINSGSSIIKNIQKQSEFDIEQTEEVEEDFDQIALKSILQIGSTTFKIKEESNLGQDSENQEELTVVAYDVKEDETTLEEVTTDVTTEVITPNPIKETFSQEYNGIKIRNETSYELTDEMLNPDSLDIDKKNILIFHTHTCESYTQSETYKYEASRKL